MKFVLALALSLVIFSQALAESIVIYIRDDVYDDYVSFLNGRDVLSISDFSGKTIRRDVVDMIIAQQALKLGGFEHSFSYAPGKVNFRNTKMLELGQLLISFDSYWLNDANAMREHLYVSDAVIRQGEYIAGIYTTPKNKDVLSINKLEDLSAFSAVSTPKWRTDWLTLSNLPIKELVREDEWLSMARMVNMQWVDFMLMPFHSTADRSFTLESIKLVPVPNVAIALYDSRHFVISKKHPYGEIAFHAIQRGLKQLRAQKKIVAAYQQARFFLPRDEIKILNETSSN